MPKLSTIAVLLFTFLTVVGCAAQDPQAAVIRRAELDPATAPDYFMGMIEDGATPKDQGIYMYGIGLAHEKTGHIKEAVDDYLCASLLGNADGKLALKRLRPGQ